MVNTEQLLVDITSLLVFGIYAKKEWLNSGQCTMAQTVPRDNRQKCFHTINRNFFTKLHYKIQSSLSQITWSMFISYFQNFFVI